MLNLLLSDQPKKKSNCDKDLENQIMGKPPQSYSADPGVEAVVLCRSLSVSPICHPLSQ